MKLDLSLPYDTIKFKSYVKKLLEKSAKVELKEVRGQRGLQQNKYYHTVLTFLANETGHTVEEIKYDTKFQFGDFMVYEKKGKKYPRSSADLDSKEMTIFIDWLRINLGAQTLGLYIPSPEDYEIHQFEIEKELGI